VRKKISFLSWKADGVIRLWDGMELKLIDSVDGDYDAVMVSYS